MTHDWHSNKLKTFSQENVLFCHIEKEGCFYFKLLRKILKVFFWFDDVEFEWEQGMHPMHMTNHHLQTAFILLFLNYHF